MIDYKKLPKIELHDHLDGGLRPQTLIELAHNLHIALPFNDETGLRAYLSQARGGSLERYLSVFGFTVPVLKQAVNVRRVAREAVEDWAADGIVYGEIRMAPELLEPELSLEESIEAILEGLAEGELSTGTKARLIICAMRSGPHGIRVAKVAARYAGSSVVGFDIAGKESGFPARNFADAFRIAADAGLGLTVHAGEAAGHESVLQAVEDCKAWRIGHGVHLHDAWIVKSDGTMNIDALSQKILNEKIGIEVCLSSNLQTAAVDSLENHPARNYLSQGFTMNLNTDNRLVSSCSLSTECALAAAIFNWSPEKIVNSMRHARSMAFDQQIFSQGLASELEQTWRLWLDNC